MSGSPNYTGAVVLLLLSLAIGGLALLLGRTTGGQTRSRPYEGGERTGHKTWIQYRIRYGVLALLFVAFDMEMVYMFPWAVAFRRLGLVAFLDMFVFLLILIAALVFAWKEGALDWER